MMKKNKNIKINNQELIKQTDEETDQIKTFIIILLGVAFVSLLLYFMSSKVLVKDGVEKDNPTTEEEIAYNNVNAGTVFNRPVDEYYVFAFDPSSLKASYYSALLNNFDNKKKQMYFMNLDLEINKPYVKEVSNSKATKTSELALKSPTLMFIKDGKIVKYLENIEEIEKEMEKKEDKK